MLCKETHNCPDRTEIDSMVGDVNLFLDDSSSCAEIDVMIAERSHQRRGLGSEAVRLMMQYGICELGVKTFYAKIKENNEQSLKMFQTKFGFKEVSRSAVFSEVTLELKVDHIADHSQESTVMGSVWLPYECTNE